MSTRPLEQLFRVRVIRMLVEEELLAPELARKLLGWKHSGFSVYNGTPLRRDDADGLERVAQYIIRNPFSEQKMVYNAENGTVIYRSRMHAKTKRKLIARLDAPSVVEKILRHLKLWPEQAEPACLSRAPPSIPPPDGGERIVELCFDDPFPDYDTEPLMAYVNDPEFAA